MAARKVFTFVILRLVAPILLAVLGYAQPAPARNSRPTVNIPERVQAARSPIDRSNRLRQRIQKTVDSLPRKSARPVRAAFWPDGTLRSAGNFLSRPYEGSAKDAALQFVKEYRGLFGIDGAPEVVLSNTVELEGRSVVRLQQTLDGMRILGREIVLTFNEVKAIDSLSNRYLPSAVRFGEWNITEDEAISSALAYRPMDSEGAPQTEKVWVDQGDRVVTAWRIVVLEKNFRGDWLFLISASDGAVLSMQDLRAGAKGNAFPVSPLESDLFTVTLNNLTSTTNLVGSNTKVYSYYPALAGVVDSGTVVQLAKADASGNFLYQLFDPRFSEVQLYYGIDRVAAMFKSLGFKGLSAPIEAVAWYEDYDAGNGFSGANNAFFSATRFAGHGGMFFYLTPRGGDTSWDADVIFHEYTHAVVNSFVGPDQGDNFRALNEGTADYFSDSFQNDPVSGEFAALIFGLRTGYIRTANNSNSFPNNIVGEVHADGNIWSGALWDIRTALGGPATDKLVLNTIASVISYAEFYDAADAAVNTADALYGSSVGDLVASVMSTRGLYSDAAQAEATAATLRTDSASTDRISAADPGYILLSGTEFKFTVPPQATSFQLDIQSSGEVYGFLKFRSPVTVFDDGTVDAEYSTSRGRQVRLTVDIASDPEIQTGTYYLDVANATVSSVQYSVRLSVFGDPKAPAFRVTNISPGDVVYGSVPTGPLLGSREFLVRAPSGATGIGFQLDGDTDVDLYIKYNNLVAYNNQGFPEADVARTSPASTEIGILTTNTIPNLQPGGAYLIGVVNYDDTSPAHFKLTTLTTNVAPAILQTRALDARANAVLSLTGSYGAALMSATQYVVTVPASANGLRVAVNTSLDASIYLRFGQPVTLGKGAANADFSFRSKEQKTFDLNTSSSKPLKPGTYYLAVANGSDDSGTVTLSYSLF